MSLNPGDRLSQYEVVEAIGAGGMGEVYRARDTRLDRDVAIKVLPDEFSRDKDRLARLEREAKLLAQLNHPNIATLHGLEEAHGQKFIVMELIEGETLAERIASGPIPVDEAMLLFQQIAGGLAVAHAKGIVHRDLKPANIKIGPDGNPEDSRLRPRQGLRQRRGTSLGFVSIADIDERYRARSHHRHGILHEPGASSRQDSRQADGYLGTRVLPVRGVDRKTRVHWRDRDRHPRGGGQGRASARPIASRNALAL